MNEAAAIVLPRVAHVKLTEDQIVLFWSKVWIAEDDECWEWLAARDRDGYGVWGTTRHGQFRSHAMSYAISGGSFDAGPIVRHFVCRNPGCVNPMHLKAGTCQDNSDDMKIHGTVLSGDRIFLKRHPELVQGERNPKAKLTAQDVVEIRRRYAAGGVMQKELAAEFGVQTQTIYCIIHRKKNGWRHIP